MNLLISTETYLPWITGVSISTDNIAKYMASRGHKVTLICPKQVVKGDVPQINGVNIVVVPSIPLLSFGNYPTAFFPAAYLTIRKLMKDTKFDIVHLQEPGTCGIATLIAAKQNKVPVFGALHFIPEQVDRLLGGKFEKILTPIVNIFIRFIYNKYDGIMTPSHFFANYLKGIGVTKPITPVSNGTDINLFHPGPKNYELKKRLGFSNDDIVFLFLGRIDRDKNVETLVRAMPGTINKVKLLLVGRGSEKPYLVKLAGKLKVQDRIVWVDYITDKEMPDYYHAVDGFSIMSPYEGQSIVTLQAVATGLPLIAADACALPELCLDGKNGFIVETYDSEVVAEKMSQLAKDEKLRSEFGKESRKISLEHDRPKVLHKLETLYEEIIASKKVRHI